MQNIKHEVKGNMLHIEVDLSKEIGLSQSGKSMLIATSGGGVAVSLEKVDTRFNISVYRKR